MTVTLDNGTFDVERTMLHPNEDEIFCNYSQYKQVWAEIEHMWTFRYFNSDECIWQKYYRCKAFTTHGCGGRLIVTRYFEQPILDKPKEGKYSFVFLMDHSCHTLSDLEGMPEEIDPADSDYEIAF